MVSRLSARALSGLGLDRATIQSLIGAVRRITPTSPTVATRSDTAGVFPAGDPTTDLTVLFVDDDGNTIATRTIRGTLNSAAGTYSMASIASTLEETTVNAVNDGTDSARMDVTHSESGVVGSASFSAIDVSVAGSTPGTITSGGGGGGGGSK